jgi:hypothetical protein
MKSSSITAVIRTLGRDTLSDAIESARSEFEKVIVVADPYAREFPEAPVPGVSYFHVGKKFDQFNGTAVNLAACVATTPYITLLDDDDEFMPSAGDFMQNTVSQSPNVDIWIPGLVYNDGHPVCLQPGMWAGNVAVPTYKVDVFWNTPFTQSSVKHQGGITDYFHVESCVENGMIVAWYGQILYLVRPKLPGGGGGL